MAGYADGTSVSADRTKAEIEQVLSKYGADQFMTGWDAATSLSVVQFRLSGRIVRLQLPMPLPTDPLICKTPGGTRRSENQIQEQLAKETRRRWRALLLVIKAKLTAVTDGISTLEREFLADIVLPNNMTLHEWIEPQVEEAYQTAVMPGIIPAAIGTGKRKP